MASEFAACLIVVESKGETATFCPGPPYVALALAKTHTKKTKAPDTGRLGFEVVYLETPGQVWDPYRAEITWPVVG